MYKNRKAVDKIIADFVFTLTCLYMLIKFDKYDKKNSILSQWI